MKTILKSIILPFLFWFLGYCELLAMIVYTEEGIGLEVSLNWSNNTAQVEELLDKNYAGNITIPSCFESYFRTFTINRIGHKAFSSSNISSIILPNTIMDIGPYAFENCTSLSTINLPNSVTNIDSYAFSGCNSLTSIVLPNCVTEIGSGAFSGCTNLCVIDIPDNLRKIDSKAFSGCKKLYEISLGTNLDQLGNGAFEGCDNLTKVSINSNTIVSNEKYQYPKDSHFSEIFGPQVTQYILGDNITSIGPYTFCNCTNLVSVDLPISLTEIGHDAFNGCSCLETINLPESVTTIGYWAFSKCVSLKEITIGCNVTSMGQYNRNLTEVFPHCENLLKVTINSDHMVGRSYNTPYGYLSLLFGPQVQQYILGDSVKSIGGNAFYCCQDLRDLVVSKNVASISSYAIYGCHNLSSIQVDVDNPIYDSRNSCNAIMVSTQNRLVLACRNTIVPDDTKTLGSYAFSYIQRGDSICLPDNITLINSDAFKNDDGIVPWIFVNRGSKTLLSVWNCGYVPCQAGTSRNIENALYCPTIKIDSITQTSAYFRIDNYYEEYNYSRDSIFSFTGLWPEINYDIGREYFGTNEMDVICFIRRPGFTTKSLEMGIVCDSISPTSVSLYGTFAEGDAILSERTLDVNGIVIDGDSCFMKGLEPSTNYSCKYSVQVLNSNTDDARLYTVTKTVKTGQLEFTTFAPKVVSEGNVIVSAETNLNDDEEVGFAWRRTDWTSDFESKKATAYLYEGMMEGIIYNLNSNYLWKYRPYYVSASGKYYYGSWMGIDPTDFSYFEPIVHTFAQVVVDGNTAQVKGSALQGTDNLSRQGFKCWPQSQGTEVSVSSVIVDSEGQMMDATFNNLEYETDYYYTAFVTTADGISYYGTIRAFTTEPNLNGIKNVEMKLPQYYADGVYSVSGYKIANSYEEIKGRLPHGIYIINGRKVSISN